MDLTREAIEKIESMAKPEIIEIDGVDYCKDHLNIVDVPTIKPLEVSTLDGLIAYLKTESVDKESHVLNVRKDSHVNFAVDLVSFPKFPSGNRDFFITCEPQLPRIGLDRFLPYENFNIMLQACFADIGDKQAVLSAISSITQNSGVELKDDGITQAVESKAGVVLKGKKELPNPVELAPYRTFIEIKQPISKYVLRVNERMELGLWEADGGAWKNDAIKRIKDYLQEHTDIVILA